MQLKEVMSQLEAMGNPGTVNIYRKHGADCPMYGVKVADLKKIVKKVKKDHELSLQLFNTGNSDAMYLAALISDDDKITKADLQSWAEKAPWYMISEYSVAWAAADSPHGLELALKWIDSDKPNVTSSGWATLSSLAGLLPSDQIDVDQWSALVDRAAAQIHEIDGRVRYTMNGFIIAAGCGIPELTEKCKALGEKIGKVKVDMGDTACKVPAISAYIKKVEDKGRIGHKKKMAKC